MNTKSYPERLSLSEVYSTSDGRAFVYLDKAREHQQSLDDKAVVERIEAVLYKEFGNTMHVLSRVREIAAKLAKAGCVFKPNP